MRGRGAPKHAQPTQRSTQLIFTKTHFHENSFSRKLFITKTLYHEKTTTHIGELSFQVRSIFSSSYGGAETPCTRCDAPTLN